jgi:C-terminal processing protease CtpA/Prc
MRTRLRPARRRLGAALLLALCMLTAVRPLAAQPAPPSPQSAADPGGALVIRGQVRYTNPFFTTGVAEPLIILEDQAGFIDRNPSFVLPLASQTIGQITSDFTRSPFAYTLSLPRQPQGTLRDVDHNGRADSGVMVFAVAFWTNKFGDPFLEERDLYGGGWSTAYASTRVTNAANRRYEVIGGKLLVYAPDAAQGFPTGFGADGLLFTPDDPIAPLPAGYTLVNLDTTPFTRDRSPSPTVDLIEPDFSALEDYSNLGYSAAFDALVDKLRREYAFTATKGIDWDALHTAFRPRFVQAEEDTSRTDYLRALRDFSFAIPDGHVSGPFLAETRRLVAGGIGLGLVELDDGTVIVGYALADGPAAAAGIQVGDTVISLNEQPTQAVLDNTTAWNGPFSTPHSQRLQQVRYASRFHVGTDVTVTYQGPDDARATTVTLTAIEELDSFTWAQPFSSDFDLPVNFRVLPSGYALAEITSFSDNEILTVQLWERLLSALRAENAPGLILDLRRNSGGSGFLANQMAAYFFDEPLELGNVGRYNPQINGFYFDPRTVERFILPPEELRYRGPVVMLLGPSCASACEFFAYNLRLQDRAAAVGHYPTAGLGGSISQVLMPTGVNFRYTSGRAVDMQGHIHIEGRGIAPTARVPVTRAAVLAEDALLDAAVDYLNRQE